MRWWCLWDCKKLIAFTFLFLVLFYLANHLIYGDTNLFFSKLYRGILFQYESGTMPWRNNFPIEYLNSVQVDVNQWFRSRRIFMTKRDFMFFFQFLFHELTPMILICWKNNIKVVNSWNSLVLLYRQYFSRFVFLREILTLCCLRGFRWLYLLFECHDAATKYTCLFCGFYI